ncbi:hypothetical protein M5K25_009117 [Dendrobium thyrsiflorum]|uniref:Uncharacterized protein n=1 Tax=Dendrobium thyrsiflorum TaxID=117978 RepID=A0ABD0VBL5_DENTH
MGNRCDAYDEMGDHLKSLFQRSRRTDKSPIYAFRSVMDLQNSAFSVQLGCSAKIQLANTIETENFGAAIQFGSVDFPAVAAKAAVASTHGVNSEGPARGPPSTETSARHAHLSVPRATITENPRGRIYVFERLSQSEAPATKRIVIVERIFMEQRREVSVPQKKKEPESLSAIVYRVLKTVKEKRLKKKRVQRPLMIEARRTPPRERLSFTMLERNERRQQAPQGEHRGVTPELYVRGSAAERSRRKGKQSWRPKLHRDDKEEKGKERIFNMGMTFDVASRRSAPNSQECQRWVQKKTHDDACYDGRHPGESSGGSRCSPTPPKEEVNFDHSPRVKEILLLNQELKIQCRRRSEIQLFEEENMEEDMKNIEDVEGEEVNDIINMEVVYMPHPRQEHQQQHEAGSTAGGGDRSPRGHEMEVEDNPFDDENTALADMRRHMR